MIVRKYGRAKCPQFGRAYALVADIKFARQARLPQPSTQSFQLSRLDPFQYYGKWPVRKAKTELSRLSAAAIRSFVDVSQRGAARLILSARLNERQQQPEHPHRASWEQPLHDGMHQERRPRSRQRER